jgi:hypothetical protein
MMDCQIQFEEDKRVEMFLSLVIIALDRVRYVALAKSDAIIHLTKNFELVIKKLTMRMSLKRSLIIIFVKKLSVSCFDTFCDAKNSARTIL